MPCLAMHVAIAHQYCKYHVDEDIETFRFGAIVPDIDPDKFTSHYGIVGKATSVKQSLENKTDIIKCINDLNIDNPHDRAKFLHLITDYLYYRYIYVADVEKITKEQLDQSLYNDYNYITYYVLDKYKITIPSQAQHLVRSKPCDGDFEFITRQQVDMFIDKIARLNLKQASEQILKDKQSFLNNFMVSLGKTINI